jgi:uncharacterized cysteine cluster protein YcgN (CxxCxxCC family)
VGKRSKKPSLEHETLCRKCGKCCREKYIVEGIVFYGKEYCRFLDSSTMLCRVYRKRATANPDCLPVSAGIKRGILPGGCPYVADIPDYIAPVEEWDDPELEEIIRETDAEYQKGKS